VTLKEHRLELTLRCPPAAAWAFLADTNRADEAAGLPSITYRDEPQEDGTSVRHFDYKLKGLPVEGIEHPFHWEEPRYFRVDRDYSRGPFKRTVHECTIEAVDPDDPSAGSRCVHLFQFEGRGVAGAVFTFGFGREVLPLMRAFFEEMDARVADDAELGDTIRDQVEVGRPRATAKQRAVIDRLAADARTVLDSPVIDRIARTVRDAPDLDLQRMQPIALANAWSLPPQQVLDAFLACTYAGLTRLRWDVICPHCRGDKQNLANLGLVRERSFCSACNIDFDVDLDRSLEAVFSPHPQARPIEIVRYCLGGPGMTRHIRAQRQLDPGEDWDFTLPLETGSYRLRFTGTDEYRWVRVAPGVDGSTQEPFVITDAGLQGPDPEQPSGEVRLALHNESKRPVLVVLEDVRWADNALPAGRLVADQRFRDLFANEMLAPGVRLEVERVAILFTDLVGSTAMYGALGDARAFNLVWSHFTVLTEVVAKHEGAIIKTIGDAIMACWTDPAKALLAAAELHDRVAPHLQESGHEYPAQLKIGMHAGPAIAVTLNDRLDYFGTTVNLAARVEGQSAGGDIVVSLETADSIDAEELLGAQGWTAEPFDGAAKGFDAPVPMLRFRPGSTMNEEAP